MIQSVSLGQRVMELFKIELVFFLITKKGISRFPQNMNWALAGNCFFLPSESHARLKNGKHLFDGHPDLGLAENSEETASLFNVYFHLR